MSTPAIPNMTSWTMTDFELAFDGVRLINDATICLQNQPRATNDHDDYHAGADFIVGMGEGWCGSMLDTIVSTLEARRFVEPGEEDRRLRLLLAYHCSWGAAGEPLTNVMQRLLTWQTAVAA